MYNLCMFEDMEVITADGISYSVPLFYITNLVYRGLSFTFCKSLNDVNNDVHLPTIRENERVRTVKKAADSKGHRRFNIVEKFDNKQIKASVDFSGPDKPYMPHLSDVIKYPIPGDSNKLFEAEKIEDFEHFYINFEWVSIYLALQVWLKPLRNPLKPTTYLKPRERFLNTTVQVPDSNDILSMWFDQINSLIEKGDDKKITNLFIRTYMEGVFRYRTSSVGIEIFVTEDGNGKKQLAHLYKSNSLLSLAWIEIMWAIDNNIYAQFCDICGGMFHLKPPYERSAYTCCDGCAKQQRILRMGGVEAVRKYNREAQRRSRNRKF